MKNTNPKETNQQLERFLKDRGNLDHAGRLIEAQRIIKQTKSIDTDKAYLQVKSRLQYRPLAIRLYHHINKYAAILLLPVLILTGWSTYQLLDQKEQPQYAETFQEIGCPTGTRSKVQLPDGTEVWLNSGSKISYQLPFSRNKRRIELEGEAFLDVAKLNGAEFNVVSGDVNVRVLGTKFNFRSYKEDDLVEVSLVEGKIDLGISNGEEKLKKATLKPGDHLSYRKVDRSTLLENTDLSKYIAWRKGRLVFDDTPLGQVAKELERWYGVEVVITDPELLSFKYTTTFEGESISQVVDLLELSSSIKIKYIPKLESGLGKAKVIFLKS